MIARVQSQGLSGLEYGLNDLVDRCPPTHESVHGIHDFSVDDVALMEAGRATALVPHGHQRELLLVLHDVILADDLQAHLSGGVVAAGADHCVVPRNCLIGTCVGKCFHADSSRLWYLL